VPTDLDPILATMIDAAIDAAVVIREIYEAPHVASSKPDGSPVTEADARGEAVILARLASTGIPVLAEESASAGRVPDLGARFFVVDPLDGTKEFLKRNGEFTVNIALCSDGVPVAGVVLVPTTGALYWGSAAGAFEAVVRDGVVTGMVPLRVDLAAPCRIVASRSHGHAALESLMAAFGITENVSVGSSLKFCLVARGDAQLYPRFTPTSEWDTAAGQAVLEAAGGVVLTLDGTPLRYGKAAPFLNPFFVAAASTDMARRAAAEMTRLLAAEAPHTRR
jgi:3'(2'), 5'-bisphosphate nucleotidase